MHTCIQVTRGERHQYDHTIDPADQSGLGVHTGHCRYRDHTFVVPRGAGICLWHGPDAGAAFNHRLFSDLVVCL